MSIERKKGYALAETANKSPAEEIMTPEIRTVFSPNLSERYPASQIVEAVAAIEADRRIPTLRLSSLKSMVISGKTTPIEKRSIA